MNKNNLVFAEMTVSGVCFLAEVCTKIHVLYIPLSRKEWYNK